MKKVSGYVNTGRLEKFKFEFDVPDDMTNEQIREEIKKKYECYIDFETEDEYEEITETITRYQKIPKDNRNSYTIRKKSLTYKVRKYKIEESSDKDVLDKIEADIEELFKWYPFTKDGAYIRKDDVKKIINKYKAESEDQE